MSNKYKLKILGLLRQLASLAVVGLCLVSLASFLPTTNWLIEILANFQLQYAWAFLFLIVCMILLKKPIWVALITAGFLINFITILPFYFQPAVQANPNERAGQPVSVMHVNINYQTTDFLPLQKLVSEINPDILVVVELPTINYQKVESLLPEYTTRFHIPGRARLGMAFFIKPQIKATFDKIYFSQYQDYPSIVAQLVDQVGQTYSFALIHPPPPITEKTQVIRNEILSGAALWAAAQANPTVILGDFNATSWSKVFQDMLVNGKLTDSRLGNGLQPSWPEFLPEIFRIPIDHVLVRDLAVVDRQILPDVGSDHLPVLIKITPN